MEHPSSRGDEVSRNRSLSHPWQKLSPLCRQDKEGGMPWWLQPARPPRSFSSPPEPRGAAPGGMLNGAASWWGSGAWKPTTGASLRTEAFPSSSKKWSHIFPSYSNQGERCLQNDPFSAWRCSKNSGVSGMKPGQKPILPTLHFWQPSQCSADLLSPPFVLDLQLSSKCPLPNP